LENFILSDYVAEAMALAAYDKLEDGSHSGRVPPCPGVVAFGRSLRECDTELRAVFEGWILLGLKLGHALPVIAGIDLNQRVAPEPVDAL
jgi:predicted RNase H-like HicB family nuclease